MNYWLSASQYNWGLRRDRAFPVLNFGTLEEGVDLLAHNFVKESVRKMGVNDATELERHLFERYI